MYLCIHVVSWYVHVPYVVVKYMYYICSSYIDLDITSLCHGMALLPLLHCSLLLMLVVTGNWSDQLMERVMHS